MSIESNSLVPILPAGHQDISLNYSTEQLELLPYLQGGGFTETFLDGCLVLVLWRFARGLEGCCGLLGSKVGDGPKEISAIHF